MKSQSWADFYKPRMNARYLHHLSTKYKVFLDLLCSVMKGSAERGAMVEMGCGAGNISKLLIERNPSRGWFHLVDIDNDMLELARQNLQGHSSVRFYKHDIKEQFSTNNYYIKCMFSHGVLEHFCEDDIKEIIDKQLACCSTLVHYVPGAKYFPHKSFGDENLWKSEEWQKICNPDNIIEFNDGYDLILTWGLNG